MALDANRLASAIRSAVNSIDVNNGEITNEDVITALASAIINEITSNGQVVVTGGSSSGTYPIT